MTVPEENPRTRFVCDGTTVRFKPSFELIGVNTYGTAGVANLSLFLEEPQTDPHPVFGTVDGAVEQILDRDWLWDKNTEECVFTEAPPAGYILVILRDTYETQEVLYQTRTPIAMDGSSEYPADKHTHLIQERLEVLRRTAKHRVGDAVFDGQYPSSFRELARVIPIEIVSNSGGGLYTCKELIFDPDINDLRDKTVSDPGGTVVTGAMYEMNLCSSAAAGERSVAYLFADTDPDLHWRFHIPGCREVMEYIACDGSGDKLYFDPDAGDLGEIILFEFK